MLHRPFISNLIQRAMPYVSCGSLSLLIACTFPPGPQPDPPPPQHQANDDGGISVDAGQQVAIAVLANDLPLGQTTLDGITSAPSKGVASVSGSNVLYTANLNASGPDSFQYQSSSKGGTGIATVTLSITPITLPDPPSAVADSYTVLRRTQQRLQVLDNDNGHGRSLSVVSLDAPGGIDNGERNLTIFQDSVIFNIYGGSGRGADSFQYTVSDGISTAQADVSITILPSALATLINNSNSKATFTVGSSMAVVQPFGVEFLEFSPNAGSRNVVGPALTTVRVTTEQPRIRNANNDVIFEASAVILENDNLIFRFEEAPTPHVFIEAGAVN